MEEKGLKLHISFLKMLIDTDSNDYIKSRTNTKYEKGSSDHIVKAFRNHTESNFYENN